MRIVRSLVVIVPAATVVTLAGIAIQYDGSEKTWLLAGLAIAGTGLTLVVLLVWLHISLTWYHRIKQPHGVLAEQVE